MTHKLKRGTVFLHKNWLDPDDKTKPMRCVVTRVGSGGVFWRPEGGGGPMWFTSDHVDRYVKEVVSV